MTILLADGMILCHDRKNKNHSITLYNMSVAMVLVLLLVSTDDRATFCCRFWTLLPYQCANRWVNGTSLPSLSVTFRLSVPPLLSK